MPGFAAVDGLDPFDHPSHNALRPEKFLREFLDGLRIVFPARKNVEIGALAVL
jgi:hypothetical protein